MRVLVVNVGSSSVKVDLLEDDGTSSFHRELEGIRALAAVIDDVPDVGAVDAVGHRVVHGGDRFVGPVVIDDTVLGGLEALDDLAPLHNPPARMAIAVARQRVPGATHVACFDTAFHRTLPAHAATYALPAAWRAVGVRRFGFHGLSHARAVRSTAAVLHRDVDDLSIVTCHVGSGVSLCAVNAGRSVDTTMGFTPLEGAVMSTRAGSVDPGALMWIQRRLGLSSEELADGLERHSGLLGLCGSGDLRAVYAALDAGEATSALAYDVYVHRLRQEVASMVASLGALDALAFTGAAGSRSARLRGDVVHGLEPLGLSIDAVRNEGAEGLGDHVVSSPGTAPAVVSVEPREELEVAHEVRSLLAGDAR